MVISQLHDDIHSHSLNQNGVCHPPARTPPHPQHNSIIDAVSLCPQPVPTWQVSVIVIPMYPYSLCHNGECDVPQNMQFSLRYSLILLMQPAVGLQKVVA